jgi:hypothetical protein
MRRSGDRNVVARNRVEHRDERLEFRFVANQRVFEATFNVNPSDLFEGTERRILIPPTVDEPTPAPLP